MAIFSWFLRVPRRSQHTCLQCTTLLQGGELRPFGDARAPLGRPMGIRTLGGFHGVAILEPRLRLTNVAKVRRTQDPGGKALAATFFRRGPGSRLARAFSGKNRLELKFEPRALGSFLVPILTKVKIGKRRSQISLGRNWSFHDHFLRPAAGKDDPRSLQV